MENREMLGNYRLVRLLGKGGFAEIYLGEHIFLKTQTAIKVLSVSMDNEMLRNFLAEARIIAHLEHPHIVRVLDFGMQEETPYLVMNLAANGTLRQRYSIGTILPLAMIIRFTQAVASALQYAHDHRVIHRDVKPENILLDRQDEVLLSDFGLAVVSQGTGDGWIHRRAGTVAYIAPEQLQRQPCQASDQYALGVVVYEWLCGRTPFLGSDEEVVRQHIQATPAYPHEFVPTIPLPVEQVVMRALSKDPAQRYPKVEDFYQALEQAARPYIAGALAEPQQPERDMSYSLVGKNVFSILPTLSHVEPPEVPLIDEGGRSEVVSSLPTIITEENVPPQGPTMSESSEPSTNSAEQIYQYAIDELPTQPIPVPPQYLIRPFITFPKE